MSESPQHEFPESSGKRSQPSDDLNSYFLDLYNECDEEPETSLENIDCTPLLSQLQIVKDRYVRRRFIAKGGMKTIYQVYDEKTARSVAMAKPNENIEQQDLDAFLREAHITARLEHPHIIPIHDIGIDTDGLPFFTMPLKKGQDLRSAMRSLHQGDSTYANLHVRMEVFIRTCEAVEHAHSRSILHLDIKPENVQLHSYGDVLLCDWGLSEVDRALSPSSENQDMDDWLDPDLYGPLIGIHGGSSGYMAPEFDSPKTPRHPRIDIYALGCLMKEWIALTSCQSDQYKISLDLSLKSMIEKCCQSDSTLRYQSVKALIDDIEKYLSGFSTSVEPHDPIRQFWLLYRRNGQLFNMTVLLLVLMMVGTIMFIYEIRTSRDHAEFALENYLREQEDKERRLQMRSALAVTDASSMTQAHWALVPNILPHLVEQSLSHIEKIIRYRPDPDHLIWEQKFWLLFLTQKFSSATKVPLHSPQRVGDLMPVAKKFSGIAGAREHLSAQELVDLFAILSKISSRRHELIEKMLIYDIGKYRRSISEVLEITMGSLEIFHPKWEADHHKYDSSTKMLKLSGKTLTSLRRKGNSPQRQSLLRVLTLDHLDISDTSISDLGELNGLSIRILNISRTPIRELKVLGNLDALEKVIIDRKQSTPELMSLLARRHIEVVVL
jgi:serine/threonine protein kinase